MCYHNILTLLSLWARGGPKKSSPFLFSPEKQTSSISTFLFVSLKLLPRPMVFNFSYGNLNHFSNYVFFFAEPSPIQNMKEELLWLRQRIWIPAGIAASVSLSPSSSCGLWIEYKPGAPLLQGSPGLHQLFWHSYK